MHRRHAHVVHLSEVAPAHTRGAEVSRFTQRQLSTASGGKRLGCSHMELPPGSKSWPFHWHAGNEEAIYILDGDGLLRLGQTSLAVHTGDYISLPTGPESAHQMVNSSMRPLRYLCFSTMEPVDVTVYPDSERHGVFGTTARERHKTARTREDFVGSGPAIDYWASED